MSDVVILTSWSQGNKKVLDLTRSNHEAYCSRHGYRLVEIESDYSPKMNMEQLRFWLSGEYRLVVTLGADILIQKPELSIEYLSSGPYVTYRELSTNRNFIPFDDNEVPLISGGLSTLQPDIVNGDFLVWNKDLLTMTWFFEEFIHSPKLHYVDTQGYISHLLKVGAKFLGIIPKLQIAPKSYNPHLDYGNTDESEYFCLHFHQPGIKPSVKSKEEAISKYLEQHQELR